MANAKISQLPAVVSANGVDLGVVVQGGTTSQITVDNLFKNRTLVAPALGTPASGTLTNCSGLPVSTGVSGLGVGVATALAVNVGSAGAPVVFGGALGTPSSGTATNITGLPISTGVSGLGTNVATALAVNVGSAGAVVVQGGALGTPSSGTLTNCTFPTLNQNTTGNSGTTSGTNVIDCTASLPAATLGKIATLSNAGSASGAWGETITSGGADTYLAFANGTNWTIIGK